MDSFVHLRIRSDHSFLKSTFLIDDIVAVCKNGNIKAAALADEGTMRGCFEFAEKAFKAGVKPIPACSLNIKIENKSKGILLLATNEKSYIRLSEISSESQRRLALYGDDSIDLDTLLSNTSDLILLSGSNGLFSFLASDSSFDQLTDRIVDSFANNARVEIARGDYILNPKEEDLLLDFAERMDLAVVATNFNYFRDESMIEAQAVLQSIGGGQSLDEKLKTAFKDFRFKNAQEMYELFSDLPEAIENAIITANQCNFFPKEREPCLPEFSDQFSSDELLTIEAECGLRKRLDALVTKGKLSSSEKVYFDRLHYELQVISNMQYSGYFLIVSEFIQWSKSQNIPVGPGRGSGAGSVVAWSIGIIDIDPIRYGLVFERFLNPDRISMPDIDVDFCQERRDEVIHHVIDKYGKERVASIATFGTLQARGVLRDVGRVLGIPYSRVDKISRMIPINVQNPVTLFEAIENDASLKRERDGDENIAKMFDIGIKLEGVKRHVSVHAAGVVISGKKLTDMIPVSIDRETGMTVTQFSMKYAEKAGLVKFDFLGLKTLTVIYRACDLVSKRTGFTFLPKDLDEDDPDLYKLLSLGRNIGVFQLETKFMSDVLQMLRPNRIEDLIALISLNRPGPMDNIPKYIARKHGNEKIEYPHPILKDILEETFGIIVYQEQVIRIAQKMAGYSAGQADILRRAMGKKIQSEMDAQRDLFIQGSINNGISIEDANLVFELVNKFAGYGFNKSHAAAYALISAQTAFLKAKYPLEFYIALMNTDVGDTEKIRIFCEDARKGGINVLPPDINESEALFTIASDDSRSIRYGLMACKGVGEQAANALQQERENNGKFFDIASLVERLDATFVNKKFFESLGKSGALDSITPNRNRKSVTESADQLSEACSVSSEYSRSGHMSLFESDDLKIDAFLKETEDWSDLEKLQQEFESLGFYLTDHPMRGLEEQRRKDVVNFPNFACISEITEKNRDKNTIACVVAFVNIRRFGKDKVALIRVTDHTGGVEIFVYNSDYVNPDILFVGSFLKISTRIRKTDDGVRVIGDAIYPLPDINKKVVRVIADMNPQGISVIGEVLCESDMGYKFIIEVESTKDKTRMIYELPKRYLFNSLVENRLKSTDGVIDVICEDIKNGQ